MKTVRYLLALMLMMSAGVMWAWPGMEMPELHVDGRYLKNERGEIVNLHGFAQTYSPWFNERGTQWTNYDVDGCLRYNKKKIDQMLEAGWKMNFIRLHMDPYWSNTPGANVQGENDISAFDFNRFCTYLDKVFIPMAEYAISKGLYVVMRPPGVCPQNIAVGDAYHNYLKKVWEHVSRHVKLKSNPHVMFELANEPVNIKGTDGNYGSGTDACFRNLTLFFQEIVDMMRANGCENILWIPGTGYQSQYAGFAKYPIKGDNIGYAVHVYPGWYGSDAIEPSQELGGSYGGGFDAFASGWNAQIRPVADIAPVMVTEMDWAPSKYEASWGKSITGKMFGEGFGANFKYLADNTGNVSWLLFTGCELLASFKDIPGVAGNYTFLNDPDACPWPVYHWYKQYAGDAMPAPLKESLTFSCAVKGDECVMMTGSSGHAAVIAEYQGYQMNVDGAVDVIVRNPEIVSWNGGQLTAHAIGETTASISYSAGGNTDCLDLKITSTPFPFLTKYFNPGIWENGSFDPETHIIQTGQWGFAGWQYSEGLDLSEFRYLVAEIEGENRCGVSFRVFDINNYWSDPAIADFGNKTKAVFDLANMTSDSGRKLDRSHIYIAGFWSTGGSPFKIARVYVSDSPDGPTAIEDIVGDTDSSPVDVYTLHGFKVKSGVAPDSALDGLAPGIYIVNGRKVVVLQ